MDKVKSFIGRIVVINTGSNSYEGTVKYIDITQKKIILKKVKDCSTGEFMRTDKHFLGDEIRDLQVKEDTTDRSQTNQENQAVTEERPSYKSEVNVIMDSSDSGMSLLQMEHMDPCRYLEGEMPQLSNTYLHDPPQALLINSIGQTFNEAVVDIGSQKVVSLVVEGTKISRFSEISLIIIGCRQMVYLFDVSSMGRSCFTEGIAEILTNQNLLKVTHDVRCVSDCLNAMYGIHPKNVFDTQVADICIQKQRQGSFPREVRPLSRCVEKYLNIHPSDCTFEKEKLTIIKKNQNNWSKLTEDQVFLKLCAKEAMYLRELRTVLLQQMLAEYLCCVDVYLNSVRSLTNQAVKLYDPTKVPRDLETMDVHKMVGRRKAVNDNDYNESNLDIDEESQERRSGWDTGHNFSTKYEERHGRMIEYTNGNSSVIDLNKPLLKSITPTSRLRNQLKATNLSDSDSVETNERSSFPDIPNIFDELVMDKRLNNRENVTVDDFRMSATSDSDDSFILSSINDKQAVTTNKKVNDRPKISSDGKRLILNNIRQYGHSDVEKSYNTSPPSNVGYQSLHESNGPDRNKRIRDGLASPPPGLSTKLSPPPGLGRKTENTKHPKTAVSCGRGRGKLLKMLAEKEHPQTFHLPIGGRSEFDFPSDNELLVTSPVAEMVANVPFGKTVTVAKK